MYVVSSNLEANDLSWSQFTCFIEHSLPNINYGSIIKPIWTLQKENVKTFINVTCLVHENKSVSQSPFQSLNKPRPISLSHFKSRLSISHTRSPIHDTSLMHGFLLQHNTHSFAQSQLTLVFFSNNRSFFCQSIDHR